MKNIKYKYDLNTRIMYKTHTGIITAHDMQTSWEWAFENNIIPSDTKLFLLDYRDAVFDNPVSISKIIIKFYHANTHWFNSCKFAIVSEKAKNIAISMIIKQADKGYRSEPFSNIEKAIEWLLSE